jgi:group I intron endonuclease
MHENKINNKKYIGITSLKPEKRWKNGKHYEDNKHFSNSILKYGWENFNHTIVQSNLKKEEALLLEKKIIKDFDLINPEKGYNKTTGGEHFSVSKETKEKLSKMRKGEKNNFYGKKHSEKSIKLMKNNRKGITSGINHPMYGKKHSKEALEKIKKSNTWYNDKMKKRNENNKKPILMINPKTNEILKEFSFVGDAINYLKITNNGKYKYTKSSIFNNIYGISKKAFGYIWKYKEVN